jgi:hypothetical protein
LRQDADLLITITDGSGTTTLCDGAERGVNKSTGPRELRVAGPVEAQQAKFFRGAAGKVWNRGNRLVSVSWSVTRELASVGAAEEFCVEHVATVKREHTIAFVAATGTKTLTDAVLVGVACAHIGLAVKIDYQAIGGALS